MEDTAGGALAADATLLAPATAAFSIWSLIYLLLLAYVVWGWTPAAARSKRWRSLGWLPAGTMVLNGAWLGITQAGWLWLSVVDIAALAVVLGVLNRRLAASRPSGALEGVVLDGTFGVYLGWVTVATCANVTAAAVAQGVDLGAVGNAVAAVLVLAVAAALGALFMRRFGVAALGVAAAMAWGLGWIAVGRLAGTPASTTVGVMAALSAVAVLAALAWSRARPAVAAA
ncbi:hypothetical protein [Propioniciclava coleopterorum]|uniref:hypothetical protein n=1 Tax=Propioniciclava coleopterorum TaxID=2714937 RepID=UPI00197EFFB2|nr:hypothetical protein [Propioniciclava coleopterorum]